jgi:hypothetical protein
MVNFVQALQGEHSPTDAGLICNYNQLVSVPVKPSQTVFGARQELQSCRAAEVMLVGHDGTVTVQDDNSIGSLGAIHIRQQL